MGVRYPDGRLWDSGDYFNGNGILLVDERIRKMGVADLRKAQEEIIDLITGGYYKEMIKLQKVMFDEYLKQGFTRKESLALIMDSCNAPSNPTN